MRDCTDYTITILCGNPAEVEDQLTKLAKSEHKGVIIVDTPIDVAEPTKITSSDFDYEIYKKCEPIELLEDVDNVDKKVIPRKLGKVVAKPVKKNVRFAYGPYMVKDH